MIIKNTDLHVMKLDNRENKVVVTCYTVTYSATKSNILGYYDNLLLLLANNKGTGKPEHPRSLINAFAI